MAGSGAAWKQSPLALSQKATMLLLSMGCPLVLTLGSFQKLNRVSSRIHACDYIAQTTSCGQNMKRAGYPKTRAVVLGCVKQGRGPG